MGWSKASKCLHRGKRIAVYDEDNFVGIFVCEDVMYENEYNNMIAKEEEDRKRTTYREERPWQTAEQRNMDSKEYDNALDRINRPIKVSLKDLNSAMA